MKFKIDYHTYDGYYFGDKSLHSIIIFDKGNNEYQFHFTDTDHLEFSLELAVDNIILKKKKDFSKRVPFLLKAEKPAYPIKIKKSDLYIPAEMVDFNAVKLQVDDKHGVTTTCVNYEFNAYVKDFEKQTYEQIKLPVVCYSNKKNSSYYEAEKLLNEIRLNTSAYELDIFTLLSILEKYDISPKKKENIQCDYE